jgi:hypothetical protein
MAIRPAARFASQLTGRLRGRELLWPWPFDLYPTFTIPGPRDSLYQRSVVNLVARDGSEISVAPEVFALSLGDWATSAAIMVEVRDADAGRRASLVGMLWSRLPDSMRQNTVTIRVYDAAYSTDPDDVHVLHRTLTDSFPVRLAPGLGAVQPLHLDGQPGPTVAIRP